MSNKHLPRNYDRTWSDEDDFEFARLYNNRVSWEQISRATGRSVPALEKRLNDPRISGLIYRKVGQKWTQHEEDELIRLYNDGVSFEEIGKAVNRSAGAASGHIHQVMQRHPERYPLFHPEERRQRLGIPSPPKEKKKKPVMVMWKNTKLNLDRVTEILDKAASGLLTHCESVVILCGVKKAFDGSIVYVISNRTESVTQAESEDIGIAAIASLKIDSARRGEETLDETRSRLEKLLYTSVNELELSVRAENCLRNANIETIGHLVMKTESDLLKFRNFGKRTLNEIKEILHRLGLGLGMTIGRQKESTKAA